MRTPSTPSGIDLSLVRKLNSKTILQILRSRGRLGRREMCELTNLSFPTVCRVIDGLVKRSFVIDVASTNIGSAKRKTHLFDIDPSGGWVMAMELGGGHIKVAAADLTGALRESVTHILENVQGEALVAPAVKSAVAELLEKCEPTMGKPLAIGVSSAGWVDPKHGIVKHSFNLQLNNFPIVRIVQQVINVPVVVNDNIVASTLAEARLGHGQQHDNFAYLAVGVGVGGGYVLNRQVLNLNSRSQFGLMVLGTEGDPDRFEGRGY
ncbi:MAG: ROK family protein, partial [Armatimonadota bacterium]